MARNTGWVPDQHGAWAMLVVPFAVGTVRGAADHGFAWASVPLFALWILGYLAFFAGGLWLKSRRRARYLRPLRTYAAATAVCGAIALVLDPGIAVWALAFVPFLGVGLWAAASRTERSVLAGGVMVAAASLMTVVAARIEGPGTIEAGGVSPEFSSAVGLAQGGVEGASGLDLPVRALVTSTEATPIWLLAGLLFAYFFGTVLYVKSMIRARGIRSYGNASVAYHAACVVAVALVAVMRDSAWWWAVAFCVALTIRAWVMLGRKVSPRAIGIGEAVASSAVLVLGLTLP